VNAWEFAESRPRSTSDGSPRRSRVRHAAPAELGTDARQRGARALEHLATQLHQPLEGVKQPPLVRRHRPTPADTLRRKLLRQLTIWLGVACLLAQISAAVHAVLLDHARCAEHGEWVHAVHEHAAVRVDVGPHGDAGGATTVEPRHSGESQEAHEHCLLRSDRHDPALIPSATLDVTELRLGRAIARVAPSSAAFSGEVYSFAPKTSPPISARSS
jgi:hypothetical protein